MLNPTRFRYKSAFIILLCRDLLQATEHFSSQNYYEDATDITRNNLCSYTVRCFLFTFLIKTFQQFNAKNRLLVFGY